MEKEINIVAPEGYEIDKENSTFECIKFKPIQRFKVGDWVVVSDKVRQLTKVVDMPYNTHQYWTSDGTWFGDATDAKLWTIEDAKDGDVLKEDSCTFIVKRMKTDGTAIIHCCLFDDGDFDSGSTLCFDVDSTYPATQEQRNLLFQKMKEAGYEWDAEKKELNLLITNGGDFFEPENCEQKPTWTWSEKDEETLSRICVIVRIYCSSRAEDILWLKSLKDRVQPQWKPSDEQMAYLVAAIEESDENCILQSLYNDLKKLIEKEV